MEFAIATTWLIRVGVLILLIGIGFFLKYAVSEGWIGPVMRVAVANRPEPVSNRTDSGSTPAAMCAAAASTSKLLFPVPGPPIRRTAPRNPGRSTSASVSVGGAGSGLVMWA